MQLENFDNDKNHFAIELAPRSERIKYGLELTNILIHEIDSLVRQHDGSLLLFNAVSISESQKEEEIVYSLNGNYYRTTTEQYLDNVAYMNRGFPFILIDVYSDPWRVGPGDPHLNEHATDEAMMRLAQAVEIFLDAGTRTQ
jgi:hypothetical protein